MSLRSSTSSAVACLVVLLSTACDPGPMAESVSALLAQTDLAADVLFSPISPLPTGTGSPTPTQTRVVITPSRTPVPSLTPRKTPMPVPAPSRTPTPGAARVLVTGGGWIPSPAGAFAAEPVLTGKAHFAFVAQYKKGTDSPTGSLEFHFNAAKFRLHAEDYDWLEVVGPKAMFGGVGTIKGAGRDKDTGHYGFLVSVIDGQFIHGESVDRFRIKIWDVSGDNALVYDTQVGDPDHADPTTELGGGRIVLHIWE